MNEIEPEPRRRPPEPRHGRWARGSLLSVLSQIDRDALLGAGVRRTVEVGDVLLREGEAGTHVLLLLDGWVKVTATAEDGHETLLSIRVAGDVIGEMAALDRSPRSATVTSCSRGLIQIVALADFRRLLRDRPEIALAVASTVGQRLRVANQRRVDFAAYPVKVRLARILVEIAQRYGEEIADGTGPALPLSQTELAALTAAAEVSVQKAVSELRRDGLVETGYRQIMVVDLDGLRSAGKIPRQIQY